MQRYNFGRELGEGAFGKVVEAVHKDSGEKVLKKTSTLTHTSSTFVSLF